MATKGLSNKKKKLSGSTDSGLSYQPPVLRSKDPVDVPKTAAESARQEREQQEQRLRKAGAEEAVIKEATAKGEAPSNLLTKTFDTLSRPYRGVTGGLKALQEGESVSEGISKGLSGETYYTSSDIVMEALGKESKDLGFLGNLLFLPIDVMIDPMTYMIGPIGRGAVKTVKQGTKAGVSAAKAAASKAKASQKLGLTRLAGTPGIAQSNAKNIYTEISKNIAPLSPKEFKNFRGELLSIENISTIQDTALKNRLSETRKGIINESKKIMDGVYGDEVLAQFGISDSTKVNELNLTQTKSVGEPELRQKTWASAAPEERLNYVYEQYNRMLYNQLESRALLPRYEFYNKLNKATRVSPVQMATTPAQTSEVLNELAKLRRLTEVQKPVGKAVAGKKRKMRKEITSTKKPLFNEKTLENLKITDGEGNPLSLYGARKRSPKITAEIGAKNTELKKLQELNLKLTQLSAEGTKQYTKDQIMRLAAKRGQTMFKIGKVEKELAALAANKTTVSNVRKPGLRIWLEGEGSDLIKKNMALMVKQQNNKMAKGLAKKINANLNEVIKIGNTARPIDKLISNPELIIQMNQDVQKIATLRYMNRDTIRALGVNVTDLEKALPIADHMRHVLTTNEKILRSMRNLKNNSTGRIPISSLNKHSRNIIGRVEDIDKYLGKSIFNQDSFQSILETSNLYNQNITKAKFWEQAVKDDVLKAWTPEAYQGKAAKEFLGRYDKINATEVRKALAPIKKLDPESYKQVAKTFNEQIKGNKTNMIAIDKRANNMLKNMEQESVSRLTAAYDAFMNQWKGAILTVGAVGYGARVALTSFLQPIMAGMSSKQAVSAVKKGSNLFKKVNDFNRKYEQILYKVSNPGMTYEQINKAAQKLLSPEDLKLMKFIEKAQKDQVLGRSMVQGELGGLNKSFEKALLNASDKALKTGNINELNKTKFSLGNLYNNVGRVSDSMTTSMRLGVYQELLDNPAVLKKYGYKSAGDFVNFSLFNPMDLHKFEKTTMKRIMPFYTFLRQQLVFNLQLIAQGNLRNVYGLQQSGKRLSQNLLSDSGDPEGLNPLEKMPDYALQRQYVPITNADGKIIYVKSELPFVGLTQFLDRGVYNQLLQNLTPALKFLIESGTGTDIFQKSDTNPAKSFYRNLLAPVRRLETAVTEPIKEYEETGDVAVPVLRSLFGSSDPDAQLSYRERQKIVALQELIDKYKEMGVPIPTWLQSYQRRYQTTPEI